MSKSYVIQWKSLVNGRAGNGKKLFDRAEAEELVEELNQEYPQIHHQAVKAEAVKTELEPELEESPITRAPELSLR